MEKHARDNKTGLLYHGWDESKQEKWADKQTGLSANFWARAMGWYGMALVDVLEQFPEKSDKRDSLIAILNRYAVAIQKVQDGKSGLWFDVLNYPYRKGNYLETSASSMFVYALAKGVRLGYLSATSLTAAKKGYKGLVDNYIVKDSSGRTNLKGIVAVSGLGGTNPYRDGSYEYYISEPVVVNDPKGVGAFIMASNEIEMAKTTYLGKGKTILMDNYFNAETKKDITGTTINWHYKWDEQDNGGFSFFKDVYNAYGVTTNTLSAAPTKENLKNANIYLIVDADTKEENPNPNFVTPKDADEVYDWVKAGGVLLLLHNDKGNAEFEHFNLLGDKFGIHFNEDSRNHVDGKKFEMGALMIPTGDKIFSTARKVYLKEICTFKLSGNAKAVYTDKGDVLMAVAKIGKGTVFAVGDPWLYNEYVDGRKLPSDFDNYKALQDLVRWSIKQVPVQ
jgi:unsaturated rhamnogalacturonyl hydrolase